MNPSPELVTKSKFAQVAGVGPSAVSNWIDREIIHGEAIVGEGRRAKINLHVALAQVRQNRDIGQALGNGIATRTSAADVPATAAAQIPLSAPPVAPIEPSQADLPMDAPAVDLTNGDAPSEKIPRTETVEDKLKLVELKRRERVNRKEAAEEALRQGKLMSADDAREQMGRIAGMMMQIFEGALPDLASAIAAQFDVPQRDVQHLLRAEFSKVRATAAKKERARADVAEKGVTTSVDLDD